MICSFRHVDWLCCEESMVKLWHEAGIHGHFHEDEAERVASVTQRQGAFGWAEVWGERVACHGAGSHKAPAGLARLRYSASIRRIERVFHRLHQDPKLFRRGPNLNLASAVHGQQGNVDAVV